MSDSKINPAGILFYGIIIAVIILVVLYFTWEPATTFFNSVGATISSWVSGVNLGNLDIGKLITDNLTTIIPTAIAGVGVLIAYFKYKGIQKTNEVLVEQQKIAASKIVDLKNTVTGQAKELTDKGEELEMYAKDETAQILQQRIQEMKNYYEPKLESYKRQMDDLNAKKTITKEDLAKALAEVKKVP